MQNLVVGTDELVMWKFCS